MIKNSNIEAWLAIKDNNIKWSDVESWLASYIKEAPKSYKEECYSDGTIKKFKPRHNLNKYEYRERAAEARNNVLKNRVIELEKEINRLKTITEV